MRKWFSRKEKYYRLVETEGDQIRDFVVAGLVAWVVVFSALMCFRAISLWYS